MKIKDLSIEEIYKMALKEMINPQKIPQICAITDKEYNTIAKKLQVWEAKGWVRKFKKGVTVFYHLNGDVLQIE